MICFLYLFVVSLFMQLFKETVVQLECAIFPCPSLWCVLFHSVHSTTATLATATTACRLSNWGFEVNLNIRQRFRIFGANVLTGGGDTWHLRLTKWVVKCSILFSEFPTAFTRFHCRSSLTSWSLTFSTACPWVLQCTYIPKEFVQNAWQRKVFTNTVWRYDYLFNVREHFLTAIIDLW